MENVWIKLIDDTEHLYQLHVIELEINFIKSHGTDFIRILITPI